MHLCKVCLLKRLKMISRKILENGGKFVNLPHCGFRQPALKVEIVRENDFFTWNWPDILTIRNIRIIRTIRIFDWKVFYIRPSTIRIRIGNPNDRLEVPISFSFFCLASDELRGVDDGERNPFPEHGFFHISKRPTLWCVPRAFDPT